VGHESERPPDPEQRLLAVHRLVLPSAPPAAAEAARAAAALVMGVVPVMSVMSHVDLARRPAELDRVDGVFRQGFAASG
jgi:hypothetical protein